MPGDTRIFVNARVRAMRTNGVNRYTTELEERMGGRFTSLAPKTSLQGIKAHLWEQAVLPAKVGRGLLWSPANCGPLAIERQVLTVHDVASLEHPEWYSRAFGAWYRWITPRLVRRVRRVITISQFSKQRLLDFTKVDESRISVIPGGVDKRFCPRTAEEIERVRVNLGIPSPCYVLSVSTLEPRKNLHRLLAAWESCAARLPRKVWLVIAGSKGPGHVFRALDLESKISRVHVTGFVADSDLPALYSGALALAYVSLYEGFGLPVLEAMASGTVPIAANNTALPEVVGDAGLLVDPFDCEAMSAGIEQVVTEPDLRRELEAKAIERSRQFSWESAALETWGTLNVEAIAA